MVEDNIKGFAEIKRHYIVNNALVMPERNFIVYQQKLAINCPASLETILFVRQDQVRFREFL